jgi:hypothetical protein
MKTGKILNDGKYGHTLHAGSFNFMFSNKNYIFDEIEKCVAKYACINANIFNLQRNFIFSEDVNYPLQIESEYDIETWEEKKLKYEIDNEFKNEDRGNLFLLRRKGLLKNEITEIK